MKCNKHTCGRSYHKNCITDNYTNYEIQNHVRLSDDGETEIESVTFTCPSHYCDVCYDVYGKRARVGPVVKCIW